MKITSKIEKLFDLQLLIPVSQIKIIIINMQNFSNIFRRYLDTIRMIFLIPLLYSRKILSVHKEKNLYEYITKIIQNT